VRVCVSRGKMSVRLRALAAPSLLSAAHLNGPHPQPGKGMQKIIGASSSSSNASGASTLDWKEENQWLCMVKQFVAHHPVQLGEHVVQVLKHLNSIIKSERSALKKHGLEVYNLLFSCSPLKKLMLAHIKLCLPLLLEHASRGNEFICKTAAEGVALYVANFHAIKNFIALLIARPALFTAHINKTVRQYVASVLVVGVQEASDEQLSALGLDCTAFLLSTSNFLSREALPGSRESGRELVRQITARLPEAYIAECVVTLPSEDAQALNAMLGKDATEPVAVTSTPSMVKRKRKITQRAKTALPAHGKRRAVLRQTSTNQTPTNANNQRPTPMRLPFSSTHKTPRKKSTPQAATMTFGAASNLRAADWGAERTAVSVKSSTKSRSNSSIHALPVQKEKVAHPAPSTTSMDTSDARSTSSISSTSSSSSSSTTTATSSSSPVIVGPASLSLLVSPHASCSGMDVDIDQQQPTTGLSASLEEAGEKAEAEEAVLEERGLLYSMERLVGLIESQVAESQRLCPMVLEM
jgi:hypothetical protein